MREDFAVYVGWEKKELTDGGGESSVNFCLLTKERLGLNQLMVDCWNSVCIL